MQCGMNDKANLQSLDLQKPTIVQTEVDKGIQESMIE